MPHSTITVNLIKENLYKFSLNFKQLTGDPISASTFSHQPHWLLNNVYTETSMSVEIKPNSIDQELNVVATMNVSSSLPSLSGTLNWRLLDETGTRIACYNIPIQLVFA